MAVVGIVSYRKRPRLIRLLVTWLLVAVTTAALMRQPDPRYLLAVLVPACLLAGLGLPDHFEVNSLHGQAVKRLAPGLRVEALAPDGLVEAFSMTGAPGFNLCVQWHPEWLAADNPVSMRMLQAFGAAARAFRDCRQTRA